MGGTSRVWYEIGAPCGPHFLPLTRKLFPQQKHSGPNGEDENCDHNSCDGTTGKGSRFISRGGCSSAGRRNDGGWYTGIVRSARRGRVGDRGVGRDWGDCGGRGSRGAFMNR